MLGALLRIGLIIVALVGGYAVITGKTSIQEIRDNPKKEAIEGTNEVIDYFQEKILYDSLNETETTIILNKIKVADITKYLETKGVECYD